MPVGKLPNTYLYHSLVTILISPLNNFKNIINPRKIFLFHPSTTKFHVFLSYLLNIFFTISTYDLYYKKINFFWIKWFWYFDTEMLLNQIYEYRNSYFWFQNYKTTRYNRYIIIIYVPIMYIVYYNITQSIFGQCSGYNILYVLG